MYRNQCEAYVIEELTIKLCDHSGNGVDTAIATDIGVTVEFDLEPGDGDDCAPQAYIKAVKAAGAALEGEKTTVNFWMGRDLLPYLSPVQVDLIAEEMIERHEKAVAEQRGEARIDAADHAAASRYH